MQLRDYVRILKHRWLLIVLVTILVVAVAVGISVTSDPVYAGEARVLITERNTAAALLGSELAQISSQPERNLQTQVELMQMRPLLEQVVAQAGLDGNVSDLRERLTVEALGQTNIVTVKVEDSDPTRAAAAANTLAGTYVDWSRETARSAIRSAADLVQERMDEVKGTPAADDQCGVLQEQLAQLKINEQLEVGSGSVVASATVPVDPVSPRPVLDGLVGGLLGLLFGVGLAFVLETADDRIREGDVAAKVYGAPVLAEIPEDKGEKGGRR